MIMVSLNGVKRHRGKLNCDPFGLSIGSFARHFATHDGEKLVGRI